MPDALPVLVASPGRGGTSRRGPPPSKQQQQQQQEELVGAAGGVHARRPSTSSSASSTSSNSSTSTVGSTGVGGGSGGMKAGSGNHNNELARLHGSPTRRRQSQPVLGALPTLHQQQPAPPSSPAKATRSSVAAAGLSGLLVVPASPGGGGGGAAAAPPVSPRPKQDEPLEEQSSPLRRSQTQHLREATAAATSGGGAPGGAAAAEQGGSSPPRPPRIGERFQIPDEDLPRNMRDDVGAACYDPWNIAACAQKGLVWHPEDVDEEAARGFAAEIAESAAAERCGDEGAELGWLVLRATGSVERAVAAAEDETLRGQWSREEEATFVQGMKDHDKNFRRIKELLPNRSLQEVIRHFYIWKQTDKYRSWKAERPLQYVEQAIPDYHADTCDKCDRPGDLLCCDTCNLAFHMRCLGLREHEVPDDFSCEQCQAQYARPEDRERAKRWVEFQVNRVLAQREKELAKCEGAPQGYIGRMRATTQAEKKKGRKRKRQDVNSTGQEDSEGEGGQGEAKRSEPATAAATAAAATAATAGGGSGRGSGSSGGQWTSLLQPLPSSSSSSASVSSAEEGKQPGGGGGGAVDYSSSSSSLNSSQRRRSGRVAAIAAGGAGAAPAAEAAVAPMDVAARR